MRDGAASASSPLFALRHVTVERGGVPILRDITLDLPRTEVTALIGPSASGKTSLLRLLNRLDDPTDGEIALDGRPLASFPVAALRRRVGFVFQAATMFPGTVDDNLEIAVALRCPGEPPPPDRVRVLEAVGLGADYLRRDAAELSGGERQRVGIARALMTRPDALLLDEPTSALDPQLAWHLMATIQALTREHGVAVVLVTHRLDEARAVSSRTVMLDQGQVVEDGPTARVFAAPNSERARAYLAAAE